MTRVLWTRIVGWASCPSKKSSMGRRVFPPGFRRRAVALVEAGRTVRDVARDLEVTEQSIYS